MDCEYTHKIGALHDNELPAAERQELEKHVTACAQCRQELESLRRLSRLFATATSAPAQDAGRKPEILRPAFSRQVGTLRLAKMLLAAAAAVLVICSGTMGYRIHSARSNDNDVASILSA